MAFAIGGIPKDGDQRIFIKCLYPLETTPYIEEAIIVNSEKIAEYLARQFDMSAISL